MIDAEHQLRDISLKGNIAVLIAYANDIGYERAFGDELKSHLQDNSLHYLKKVT